MAQNLFNLKNKIIVITGGLGQLGRQFSLSLRGQGAKVAVFDINAGKQHRLRKFASRHADKNIMFLDVDVTDKNSVAAGLKQVRSVWGIPHALINNAAQDFPPRARAQENGPFEAYPEDSWDKVMGVNVKGAFLCSQAIGAQMAKAGRGSIINISSVYGMVSPDQRVYKGSRPGQQPFFKPAVYAVSKSALLNLTRYLATYWADRNVRVNTLTLSGVFNRQNNEFIKRYNLRVPLGRMAKEDEYNGAVIFLISDASSYMTGSNLIIDGGWTAW